MPIHYTVDDANTITNVRGDWDEFARANDSKALVDNVLGRPIWDFLSVPAVLQLYQELFSAVRRHAKAVALHFRCDSDAVLRFMTMRIDPGEQGALDITTELIREVSRKQVLGREIIYMGISGGTPMCSQCNKIHVRKIDLWMEIDYALALGYISDKLNVNFSICDSCVDTFHRKIKSMA
jgi:hypothetical protein